MQRQNASQHFRPILHYWPVIVLSAALIVLVITRFSESSAQNNGKFIYALDDAYIHMSMAKNLVQHGVWGVTRYETASASSSPLWTGLVAMTYIVAGVGELPPLVLNVILACGLLAAMHTILTRCGVSPAISLIVTALTLILWQVDRQIFMGMEHVLQALVNLVFTAVAAARVCGDETPLSRGMLPVYLLGMLVPLARYEGLLLVLAICMVFTLRGRLISAIVLGFTSLVPVLLLGLIFSNQGWGLLPSSVQLNSSLSFLDQATFGEVLHFFTVGTFEAVMHNPTMISTLAAAAFVFLLRYRDAAPLWNVPNAMLVTLALLVVLHARLVNPAGTHLRYGAYLLPLAAAITSVGAAGFIALPRSIRLQSILGWAAGLIVFAMLVQPWYDRYQTLQTYVPLLGSMNNIYEQQYQMARFFDRYYQGEAVAANDIGAINYFADIRTIDLWGLATREVMEARLNHRYDTEVIRSVMQERHGRVAILYDYWFNDNFGGVPPEWIIVGQWGVEPSKSAILGGHTVTFYAVNAAEAEILAANLRDFATSLPTSVIQTGPFVDEMTQPAALSQ